MSKLSIVALVLAGLMASPAEAGRRSRRTSRLWEELPTRTNTGDFGMTTTDHQSSYATCDATVSATTASHAKSALVDVYAELFKGFCSGFDKVNRDIMDSRIRAVAKLTLESKIKCTTTGKYAWACGGTWADATSYAGAAFQAYATAVARVRDEGECSCARDLTADSEVTVQAFGDIWAQVYAALDDYTCASSVEFDDKPSTVEQTKIIDCTSRVVYNVWAKAAAGAWVRSECSNNRPARCETCCVSEEGSPLPGCDCEAWQQQCHEVVDDWAKATAFAEIKGKEVTNTASCEGTLIDELNEDAETAKTYFTPLWTSTNTVNDDCANANSKCVAFTKAKATAEAASAQATNVVKLATSICKVPAPTTLEIIAEGIQAPANAIATATADVYAKASAQCWISDAVDEHHVPCLDPYFDGGCAYAKAWVQAYASACAEAVASASANITFGSKPTTDLNAYTFGYQGSGADCDCNLGGKALGAALALEIETIHASAVSMVEAEACTDGVLWSEVAQRCMAKSVAELYAKAVAKVLLRNNCVTADKATYCNGECQGYNVGTEWESCIARCTQHADAEATALVEAMATLDLTNTESCREPSFHGLGFYEGSTSVTTLQS